MISIRNKYKICASQNYNYIFNSEDGSFMRWGFNTYDNPKFSPFGPEIADIEITTKCGYGCPYCYKNNNTNGHNMSLETFKSIFHKINYNNQLTQIAFGSDSNLKSNPDLFEMMKFCRENGVVPNITVADIDIATAYKLNSLCGAVSVSLHADPKDCYRSINLLYEAMKSKPGTLRQVNQHIVLCKEKLSDIYQAFDQFENSYNDNKVNAIVLLTLKQKGRGTNFTPISFVEYANLVKYALDKNISLGFDSCSAPIFLKVIEGSKLQKRFEELSEPCESMLFSIYLDVHGNIYPCSFCEDIPGLLIENINKVNSLKDIWNSDKVTVWRDRLLGSSSGCDCFYSTTEVCRSCPVFNITPCRSIYSRNI